jgi:signal transduction histidine kinase
MAGDRQLTEQQSILLSLTQLRLFVAVLCLLVVLYLKFVVNFVFPIEPIIILFLVITAVNGLYRLVTPRFPDFSHHFMFYYLRSTFDAAMITILIHYTGGVKSPFILIYLIGLISVSIIGQTNIAYVLAIQVALFYLASNLLEASFVLPHYQLPILQGSLYLNINYILALTCSLLLTSLTLIYMVSFLTRKIINSQQQIEALSNARIHFINQVAHEIRSPLTSVVGYTQLLTEQKLGPLPEAQQEPVHIIQRQAQRILDMVNDLLNISRLESGTVKLNKKSASLIEVARQAIEAFGPQINAKKIILVQEFDPQTPPVVIDEDKMIEVFTNLISNSIKFCGNGCRVFLSIAPGKNEVLVSLRDEGLGIEPVDLPHIFERFYRANKESAERKGTGLGLALTKTIIEAHGGRIWAVSAGVGQGTIFYFALPLST